MLRDLERKKRSLSSCERGTLLTGRSLNPTLIDRTSFNTRFKAFATTKHHGDWCKQSLLKRGDETFNQGMCNEAKRSGFENSVSTLGISQR